MPATRAVLLDALGTLVRLDSPFERLAAAIGEGATAASVEAAMRVEMAYYREHCGEARDAGSLARLRHRCARLLSSELGREVDVETMMSAIRFRPFGDARPALKELRPRVPALVCVSNWDFELPEVLERAGLAVLLDGVVTSAGAGAAKPDPAIFRAALDVAGCAAEEALMVGDSPAEDAGGARSAGIPALVLDRSGGEAERGRISSLGEISHHLALE